VFESDDDDDDEGAIKAGGNKVGSGEGFFAFSVSNFLGMGGLRVVSEKLNGGCDSNQPILLVWVVVRHRCRNTALQSGAPELGLEGENLILGPFEVFSKFQVDLQCLLACLDMFSQLVFKKAQPFIEPHDVGLKIWGASRVFRLLNGFETKVLSKAGCSLISIEEL